MTAVAVARTADGADRARVRSTDAELAALIREGTARSAAFRALVDEIERSDAIVYVESGYCAFGHLNGCLLRFIAQVQGDRYLRILVTSDHNRVSHEHRIALVAHELQHALEVIRHREVVDVASLERLYLGIGTPETGVDAYETSAARSAGDTVLSELFSAANDHPSVLPEPIARAAALPAARAGNDPAHRRRD